MKLTLNDVIAIRVAFRRGASIPTLAEKYQVTENQVRIAINRQSPMAKTGDQIRHRAHFNTRESRKGGWK